MSSVVVPHTEQFKYRRVRIPINPDTIYCNMVTTAIQDNSDIFKVFMTETDHVRMINYLNEIIEALHKLNVNIDKDNFLAKSYLSLLLPFNLDTSDNPELISNSANASFLIAQSGSTDEKIYIKEVDFEAQRLINSGRNTDLIIYDVMAGIIFESIFEKEHYKNKRNIIPIYKGCCLSYIKKMNLKKYWDYNEIYDYCGKESKLSPYYPLNLQTNSNVYNKQAILVFYEAIDNPISVYNLFLLYYKSSNREPYRGKIIKMFDKYYDVFTFLLDIGTEYGFVHNDLHTNNIIYDQTKDELMIIDFGRSYFKPLSDEKINEAIKVEFDKLNYHEILTDVDNINEEKLYNIYENLYKYTIKSQEFTTDIWGGIIFDLITISINMYVKLLAFLYVDNKEEFNELYKWFNTIININYDNISNLFHEFYIVSYPLYYLNDILSQYKIIKSQFLSTIVDDNKRRLYEIILEGLLYAGVVRYNFTNYLRQIIFPAEHYNKYFQNIAVFRKKINENLSKEEIETNFKFVYRSNKFAPSMSNYGGRNATKHITKKPVSLGDTISAYKKMFVKTKKGGYKKLLKKY